jgi:hypothetical protein
MRPFLFCVKSIVPGFASSLARLPEKDLHTDDKVSSGCMDPVK